MLQRFLSLETLALQAIRVVQYDVIVRHINQRFLGFEFAGYNNYMQ